VLAPAVFPFLEGRLSRTWRLRHGSAPSDGSLLEGLPRSEGGRLEQRVWDAVVVGAGPGGAMTAYQLGRAGKSVLLLDRQAFPRWKVCGATLSPGVPDLLTRAGLSGYLEGAGARPLHTLRLGGWSTRADLPLNGTVALSRVTLDGALVHAAVDQGVVFVPGARAVLGDLSGDRRRLRVTLEGNQTQVSARVVIAADGLMSPLLANAGISSQVGGSSRRRLIGVGATFSASTVGFQVGVVHMALAEDGYVGLVRVEDGSLNVAAALAPDALKGGRSAPGVVDSILGGAGWPSLPDTPLRGWKGTPELTRTPLRLGAERIFAVGDAGGYVEPFTGEGVFWALAGARALGPLVARASESWDDGLLTHWTQAHRRLVGRAQRICRATAWTLARPSVSRSALRLMSRHPRVAAPLVRRVGSPLAPGA
jgi:flavin-dependent dehydrogenase